MPRDVSVADLEGMGLKDLRDLATDHKVKGRAGLNKDELVEALRFFAVERDVPLTATPLTVSPDDRLDSVEERMGALEARVDALDARTKASSTILGS